MKHHTKFATVFLSCGALISAEAQDGTWNKNATGTQNWSTATNWSGNNIAGGVGASAYLGDFINADRVITLDTAITIGNIYAQDTTHNYTISGPNTLTLDTNILPSILNVATAGRTLHIGSSTTTTAVTVNEGIEKTGAGLLNFVAPITLDASQTWTNNSTGAIATGNGTNLISLGSHTLTLEGTGVMNFGVANNAAVTLSGSGALVKNGTGRANFGGLNSGFSGPVTINGGVLRMYNDAGALGSGNLTLNGGVLSFYFTAAYSRTLGTGTNQVQILGGQSGFGGEASSGPPTINLGSTVVWGASGEGAATGFFNPSKLILGDSGTPNTGIMTFSSGIDLNGGTRTIVVPQGMGAGRLRTTISAAISDSTATDTVGIIKEGNGLLILSNASSAWKGATTISGGLLDFSGNTLANIGGGSGRNISVAVGAAVRLNAMSNARLNRIVETTDEIGIMTGTTANNLDFSSSAGAALPNAFLGNWASNSSKAEYSGTLTPAADNYRLGARFSEGLLGIVGTNKLTGAQGLMVGGTGGSGIRVELAGANNFTGDTVINTGAKLTLGNNLALQNSALNLGSAGGFFALSNGTNTGRITGDVASPSPTFGGLIGSRNLIAAFSTTAGNNESLLSAAAVTGFTLNVSTGKTHTYAGAIGGFGAGASGSTGGAATLTKTGEGTQILTGTSSYTGATTISGGTLALGAAGAISGSASLLISAGGTLDTSAKPTYAIAASQTLEIGIDPMGAGTTGKILAAGLDVSNATVTVTAAAPLDDPAYVLATYTTLTGNFLSPPTIPPGYALDYAYEGNKIALVSTGAPVGFAAWQLANGTTGNRAADHDGDGVPNGIENFLGGSTNTTDPTPLPSVDASSASITWTKSPSYTGAYGTDFVVESSDTLSGDWMPQTLGGTVTISGNNVTYRFPTPLSGKKFARLRVSGP